MSNFGLLRLRISRCSDCSDFLYNNHFFQSKHPKSMLGNHRLQVLPHSTVAEVNCKQLSNFNKKESKPDFLTSIMSRNLQICFTTLTIMLSIYYLKSCIYIFFHFILLSPYLHILYACLSRFENYLEE